MAADVKPRIVRETTTMERAALRDQRANAADHVDPEIIDNALADLEMARIFLDAARRYHDELTEWLRPNGHMPFPPLNDEVNKAQAIMNTADDRIGFAQEHLRKALGQAWASIPATRRAASPSFENAWQAYVAAFNAANAFHLLNYPGDGNDDTKFQQSFDAQVDIVRTAARILLDVPAGSADDMRRKQVVIDQQEAIHWDGNEVADFTRQLIADAIAFAGGAA